MSKTALAMSEAALITNVRTAWSSIASETLNNLMTSIPGRDTGHNALAAAHFQKSLVSRLRITLNLCLKYALNISISHISLHFQKASYFSYSVKYR